MKFVTDQEGYSKEKAEEKGYIHTFPEHKRLLNKMMKETSLLLDTTEEFVENIAFRSLKFVLGFSSIKHVTEREVYSREHIRIIHDIYLDTILVLLTLEGFNYKETENKISAYWQSIFPDMVGLYFPEKQKKG